MSRNAVPQVRSCRFLTCRRPADSPSVSSPTACGRTTTPGKPKCLRSTCTGRSRRVYRITGATVEDWEAMAVGPCPGGSCLFIADIGDNSAKRQSITVYRLTEPSGKDASVAGADVIQLKYPDGAHDAEALLVTPDGTMLIVTKGETGPVNAYRVPANARPGATVTLERIGGSIQGKAAQDQRITDGAVSPDGQWVALRSRGSLVFFRTTDFLEGQWNEARRVDLAALREPQGEGVALGSTNTVYLAGEGGGKGQPGTLIRFTCEVPP